MIISEELITKITFQIRHELENAQYYAYFSDWFSVQGLNNLSEYYRLWSDEEKRHSTLFRELLTDLDITPKRLEIPAVDFEINDHKTIADKTMEREILTTQLIGDELSTSYSDGDGISSEFLLMMQKEQREELNKASNIKMQLYGTNDIYSFDNTFEVG